MNELGQFIAHCVGWLIAAILAILFLGVAAHAVFSSFFQAKRKYENTNPNKKESTP